MVSAINPNFPLDNLPAQKSDLRNNLAAARTEIEALQAIAASLPASSFPTLLDLGGTRQAGGARSIFRKISTVTSLQQEDAGGYIIKNDTPSTTWNVPDLLEGTIIQIVALRGEVVLNPTGNDTVKGGLTVPLGAVAAVMYFSGEILLVGTV